MFNQKEMTMLQDLKKSEQTCAEKYSKYAQQASSSQLQGLFQTISGQEQQHLQTIQQMLNGSIPSTQSSSSGSSSSSSSSSGSSSGGSFGSSLSGSASGGQGSSYSSQSGRGSQQGSGSQSGSCHGGSCQSSSYQGQRSQAYQNDSFLCNDALAMEKHVSSDYNTSIFEFRDQNARNTLNHIQKEEQEHGKMIYDYMSQNGMYN